MGFSLPKKKYTEKWSSPSPTPTNSQSPSSWASWPSCNHLKTLSFRADEYENDYGSGSWFTTSSSGEESDDLSSMASDNESVDSIVHRLTPADRLQYKPSMNTKSILEESKAGKGFPFKDGSVVVVNSNDPYSAFKLSMAEMVAECGLESVECLQELLEWYLKVNGEDRQDVIVEAFLDLVLELFSLDSFPPSSC